MPSDLDRGLELFDTAIDAYQRAGNDVDMAAALAALTVFFDHHHQPDIAATIYGIKTQYAATAVWVVDFSTTIEHIRATLGDAEFDERVATGAAMNPGDALRYARDQIQVARDDAQRNRAHVSLTTSRSPYEAALQGVRRRRVEGVVSQ